MFTIRRAQIEAMAEPLRRRFERELTDRLRGAYPEAAIRLGDEALGRLVRKGISRAAEHGVTLDGDVRDLVELFLLHGLDFERLEEKQRANVLSLLSDPTLSGRVKVALLRGDLTDGKKEEGS